MDSFKFIASMAVENTMENAKALAAGSLETMQSGVTSVQSGGGFGGLYDSSNEGAGASSSAANIATTAFRTEDMEVGGARQGGSVQGAAVSADDFLSGRLPGGADYGAAESVVRADGDASDSRPSAMAAFARKSAVVSKDICR